MLSLLFLIAVAAMVLGRAIPYTLFEHSPFEGVQMKEIERLRLRGVSEKEISARYASPHPQPLALAAPDSVLDVTTSTTTTTRYKLQNILSNLIARADVAAERQGDVLQAVDETLHAASENTDVKQETLDLQVAQDLDTRAYAVQGSGEVLVEAGGDVKMVERDVDHSMCDEEKSEMDAGAQDVGKRSPSNVDQQDEGLQAYGNDLDQRQRVVGERSESTGAEEGVAKGKRSVDINAEDGGLEVRGQMGGLKVTQV